MQAGRCIWISLGIIVQILIYCSAHDNGGFLEECAAKEVMFGCKDEGDIVVIKDAWIHKSYYRSPPSSCHIPEFNVQFKIESILQYMNKKCASTYLCRFNLFEDVPGAESRTKWKDGVIQLNYECVFDLASKTTCGTFISDQEGWIRNVGYPNYYLGPGACTFTIQVDEGQHIDLNIFDLSLKEIVRPMETVCADEMVVSEGQKQLFSRCGTINHPVNIISEKNVLNVTLHSGAEVFLNRGFYIHFKAIGCQTPADSTGGFLSSRNADMAEFRCSDEYLFPDSLLSRRFLRCVEQSEWDLDVPNCIHLEDLLNSGNITKNEYLLFNGSSPVTEIPKTDMLYVVIIPSTIMALLVVGNLGILILIAFCRRRNKTSKFEELEEAKNGSSAPISTKIFEKDGKT